MDKLTGKKFWEDFYNKNISSKKIKKSGYGIIDYHLIKIFNRLMKSKKDCHYFELGCGNSNWILYFNKYFNCNVSGVDYSDIGVSLLRKRLKIEKIKASIYKEDFLKENKKLYNSFDIVASYGVVEHFNDTLEVLKKFSLFLKKEGLLITGIPKLVGIQGFLQKKLDRDIFEKHKPLEKNYLIDLYKKLNIEILEIKEIGLFSVGFNFKEKALLSRIYRYYRGFIDKFLKYIIFYRIVNSLRLGSYYIIIGRKKD